MSGEQLVSWQVLDDCYVRVGRWSKERLYLLQHASGRAQIAYPIRNERREPLVWVTVIEL